MTLLKKAARGIWHGKRSYLSCIALMALGIAIHVSFHLLYLNLVASRDNMYQNQRFADVFASVRAITPADAEALASIPGVARVDHRLQVQARVLMEGDSRIIYLRLLSFRPEEAEPLNAFLLTEGSLPADDGLLAGEAFAQAHGLQEGDAVTLLYGGRKSTWAVSGAVKSPDYVYVISDASQLLPDTATFGVAYMPYQSLSALTGRSGSVNDLSFLLEEGVSYDDVKYLLEDALAPYGLEALYPRKDQPSHSMLKTEIDQMGNMASSIPMLFILIAMVILYIMLVRMVEQERGQIGTLKALGFSNAAIVGHYVLYGLLVGVVGGALGLVFGLMLADGMTGIYLEYFYLPGLDVPPEPYILLQGFLLSVLSGAAGAWMGTRAVIKLLPAEAMRPPAPRQVHGDWLDRIPALRALLASHGQMAVRNITRNRFRSAFVLMGIALSFAIMAFMASYSEMMDALTRDQFQKVQLYDLKVTLESFSPPAAAVEAAYRVDGVQAAEALLEIPASLRNRHRKEDAMITGIASGSALYRIYDNRYDRNLPPPTGGVVLSLSLAEKLEAKRGDMLAATTPYTGEREIFLPVLDVVEVNMGSAVYMEQASLCDFLGIPAAANSVLVNTDDAEAVKAHVTEGKNVKTVSDTVAEKRTYDQLMESYSGMIYMMQLAGIGIAFAIITVTASISLSERKREYATLRVIGMHPREVAAVSSFEYWILTIGAVIAGIPLTRLMKIGIGSSMETEMFTFPVDTAPRAFVAAAVGCVVAVTLSNLIVARSIGELDMVEVLKERE